MKLILYRFFFSKAQKIIKFSVSDVKRERKHNTNIFQFLLRYFEFLIREQLKNVPKMQLIYTVSHKYVYILNIQLKKKSYIGVRFVQYQLYL